MDNIDNAMREMTFEFFAGGKHKIDPGKHLESENAIILDVRSREECDTVSFDLKYHIPVIRIPVNEIPDRTDEIPKEKNIGIFCSAGVRASMVYIYLKARGYDKVRILAGGYNTIMDELKPGKILKRIQ